MPGKVVEKVMAAISALIAAVVGGIQRASAQYIPSDIAQQFTNAVRQIVIEVVNFVTPIINIIGAAMVILGLVLIAARQEFYGLRLIIGGGVTLVFMNIVIPVILSFL